MEKLPITELKNIVPQIGSVTWIGVRKERKAPLTAAEKVFANEEKGLAGDHFSGTYSKKRQVTLIQDEHLEAVGSMLGKDKIDPGDTRRNIVVKGINLLALKDQRFQIGEVILEGTGLCHPCTRMEENLGTGGYNAMRGHGGLTATIIKSGEIKVGDEVRLTLT